MTRHPPYPQHINLQLSFRVVTNDLNPVPANGGQSEMEQSMKDFPDLPTRRGCQSPSFCFSVLNCRSLTLAEIARAADWQTHPRMRQLSCGLYDSPRWHFHPFTVNRCRLDLADENVEHFADEFYLSLALAALVGVFLHFSQIANTQQDPTLALTY